MAVTPPPHPPLPAPEELLRHHRVPLRRRFAIVFNAVRHDGRVQFAAVFAAFVVVGTVMMHLLEGGATGSAFADLFSDFWFTVVTITTVGYGDIAPTQPAARLWAMLEMVVGIGLVGVITGAIASALVEGNRRRALGLAPLSHVQDHIVVCGWKRDMRNILLGILHANPALTSYDLVLVTAHAPNEIGDLRREGTLRGLHFVYGSHTDRTVLEMAQVQRAQRVIILADESGRHSGDPDSRTVLAATAVEAITSAVYTCTEIVQPHFADYLRPAGVEEVVLEARNSRALIVAGSLGEGLANVMARFLPESGQQLRVVDVPPAMVGATYAELAERARERGYLPIGMLDNTGSLYERKEERIAEALRLVDRREAVARLLSAAHLVSNVPRLAPPLDWIVRPNSKIVVLLPSGERQPAEQAQRRSTVTVEPWPQHPGRLLVCGWKRDMAGLLLAIRARHEAAGLPLERLSVAARLPGPELEALSREPELEDVQIVVGEPTDPAVLRRAGVGDAERVLIVADPVPELSTQEVDARNVMVAFAINELNPSVYKCVEILNPSFGEHLRVANVEEPVYTGQYQRMMLVQASLGTGLAGAVGALVEPAPARLRVVEFAPAPPATPFAEHGRLLAEQGLLLIGVMEHTGNSYIRKTEYVRQAQVQSGVGDAVQHLLRLKTVQTNAPVINPEATYLPGLHSRALVIAGE